MNIARNWRLIPPRYRLAGRKCPSCQALLFPPRAVCPQCGVRLAPVVAEGVPVELAAQIAWPRLPGRDAAALPMLMVHRTVSN